MGIEPGTLYIPGKQSSYILTNNLVKTTLSYRVVETLGKNELYHQSGSATLRESLPAKASDVDTAVAYDKSKEGNKSDMPADPTSDVINYGK